jgi:hypothetical protein
VIRASRFTSESVSAIVAFPVTSLRSALVTAIEPMWRDFSPFISIQQQLADDRAVSFRSCHLSVLGGTCREICPFGLCRSQKWSVKDGRNVRSDYCRRKQVEYGLVQNWFGKEGIGVKGVECGSCHHSKAPVQFGHDDRHFSQYLNRERCQSVS